MPRNSELKPPRRQAIDQGRVRKEFWLDPKSLRAAQKALGATSERETVEIALDLVSFRKELVAGVRALRKLPLNRR